MPSAIGNSSRQYFGKARQARHASIRTVVRHLLSRQLRFGSCYYQRPPRRYGAPRLSKHTYCSGVQWSYIPCASLWMEMGRTRIRRSCIRWLGTCTRRPSRLVGRAWWCGDRHRHSVDICTAFRNKKCRHLALADIRRRQVRIVGIDKMVNKY